MKENVKNVSERSSIEKRENMRWNSVNSRKIMSLWIIYVLYCWQYIFNNHFKHFDFIEWFDLNSNPKSLFERLSISDFLVDCLMCIRI